MRRSTTPTPRGDDGAIAVITALSMAMLVMIAAIVIDLGFVRGRAITDQTAADLAALAGGSALANRNPVVACEDAFNSLRTNLSDAPLIASGSLCSAMAGTVCSITSGTATATAATTAGRYTLFVRYPAADSEIADPVFGVGRRDGQQCERMRLSVTSNEPVFFGRLLGRTSYVVTRTATVRATYRPSPRIPALWLLDPWGCTSLAVTGGSRLTAGTTSPVVPGIITIDSDGSACSGSQRTVSSTGTGTRLEAVPDSGAAGGSIDLFAQPRNATTCSGYACDPADVASGRLSPQPGFTATRATRLPMDWRYNCRASYPSYHGLAINACPQGTPGYLDLLRTSIGSTGSPGGFQRWRGAGHSCNPAGTITVSGNWWIDCPGGLSIGTGTSVTFANGNIVLDAGISMTGGALRFNTSNSVPNLSSACLPPAVTVPCLTTTSTEAAFIYLRTGSINVTGGNLTANHATTILADGYVKITGGAPPTWLAPTEGPFAGLALWSELSSSQFQINGGAGATLEGTFFTPEAKPFTLSGGGSWGQQKAQFITYQLAVSGGANLSLAPNDSSIALPVKDIRLIR